MSLDITPAEALLVSPEMTEPGGISDRTIWIMAAACGTSAANIYYNQPLLGDIASYFHSTAAQAGMVSTAAQVGYGVGIFFFVPLGDLIERRKVVLALVWFCCVLLVATALAPALWVLVLCQLLVGITAVSAQVLIPLGIDLTPPERRGHTVGVLMAGLLCGILMARTVAGFLSDATNWRVTYGMAAGLMLVMGFVLRASLPHRLPSLRMSYGRLMHSLLELLETQPKLWRAAIISGLSFATFTGFWTTLSFLMKEHFHRGASEAGMFGIVGLAGALAAPLAGKLSDKRGTEFTNFLALASTMLGFVILAVWVTIPGLIIGVLLLDLGVQSTQVSQQAAVMALVPEARSRVNTLYMVGRFMGGAAGSAVAALVWSHYRWTGVCAVNLGILLLAMVVQVSGKAE
jgi:predicted MFS family arabinose efflux permease